MITRKEFLLTADPDHAIAAQQARDYVPPAYIWRIQGDVRKTQVETSNIINGTEDRLQGLIDAPDTDEQVKAVAVKVLRALRSLYKPEFYINLADPEVSQLFGAAQALGVLNMDEVTRITAAAFYEPAPPWPNTTTHDVKIERDDCETKVVIAQGLWASIETNVKTERHNPRLWVISPITGNKQRANSFMGVEKAGKYECRIPREFAGWPLAVDNPYQAIV